MVVIDKEGVLFGACEFSRIQRYEQDRIQFVQVIIYQNSVIPACRLLYSDLLLSLVVSRFIAVGYCRMISEFNMSNVLPRNYYA